MKLNESVVLIVLDSSFLFSLYYSVTSALQVYLKRYMRYINPRFTYLLTCLLLTYGGTARLLKIIYQNDITCRIIKHFVNVITLVAQVLVSRSGTLR